MDKEEALKVAIEIAKEAARGGHQGPDSVIEYCYKKILELSNS